MHLLDDFPHVVAGGSFLESVKLGAREHEALVVHVARACKPYQTLVTTRLDRTLCLIG